MLRARFAYFNVLRVSSAFVSAGLTQATSHKLRKVMIVSLLRKIYTYSVAQT